MGIPQKELMNMYKKEKLINEIRKTAIDTINYCDDYNSKILAILLCSLDHNKKTKNKINIAKEMTKTLKESKKKLYSSKSMYSTRPTDNEIMIRTIRNVKESCLNEKNAKSIRQSLIKILKKEVDSNNLEIHSNFSPCEYDNLELKLSVFGLSQNKLQKLTNMIDEFVKEHGGSESTPDEMNNRCISLSSGQSIIVSPVQKVYRAGKGFERETNHIGIRVIGFKK